MFVVVVKVLVDPFLDQLRSWSTVHLHIAGSLESNQSNTHTYRYGGRRYHRASLHP